MFGIDARAARAAWTVGLVAVAFYAAYLVRKTLLVFVLALFLAYLIAPLVRRIERINWRGLPRTVSVAEAFLLVIALGAIGFAALAPSASDEARKLAEQLPRLTEKSALMETVALPAWLEPYRERVSALAQEAIQDAAQAVLPLAKNLAAGAVHLAGNLVFVALIPILAFMFVKDGPRIAQGFLRELGPNAPRGRIVGILSDLHEALGHYVRALGLLVLATLVAYAIFFGLVKVPYGILLAALAAVLEVIPVLGPLAAAALSLFVAGISGYDHLLWMVAFFISYRIFQDYVLAPWLMGGGIGIHPVLVIFGLLAGEQLGGIAGVFLSIPVIAALAILARHLRGKGPG
ncbi:MAG TPA: AI-2E family transporter [Burkholderiales bacterium]